MRFFDTTHIHRSFLAIARPAYALALILGATHTTAHGVIVRGIDHHLGIVEQLQLLHTFLVKGTEVLLMGAAQRCQHADRGLDDVAQGQHLAWLADACLEEGHLGLLVQQPHAEWHANLRVIALGRAGHLHRRHQDLIEPLLDPRLTVRTRDAHHRDVELVAMTLSQSL